METEVDLTQPIDEDRVWRELARPVFENLSRNALDICHYGFTEILNNAIEHSEGKRARVSVSNEPHKVTLSIWDDGVGIFGKIQQAFHLPDEHDAVLEIVKGKLTTDAQSHSGERIFFTSRLFDDFSVFSHSLSLHHRGGKDWVLEKRERADGTLVVMGLDPRAERTTKEVFDRFTSSQEYAFDVSHVPVALAQHGQENLISRSQAKRVLSRLHKFRKVILDFSGLEMIGQAFADEIFRVFRNQHPEVELVAVNTSQAVQQMIQRAESHSQ